MAKRSKAGVTGLNATTWRPLAFGLAAAFVCTSQFLACHAKAQSGSLGEKIQLCLACHGEDGNSRIEKIPSLAGQPAFFVLNQLFLMREGVRKVEAMAAIVKDLKDEDLTGLSEHFAKLPAKRSDEPIDAALAKKGAEIAAQRRCSSCHLPTLAGQEQMPRVAKQRIDYLVDVLKSYRDTPRPGADTAMSVPISGASDADITALAHYAASL
jgi:cytochrome c553